MECRLHTLWSDTPDSQHSDMNLSVTNSSERKPFAMASFYNSKFYEQWCPVLCSTGRIDGSLELLTKATQAATEFAALSVSQMVSLCPHYRYLEMYPEFELAEEDLEIKLRLWKKITAMVPETTRKDVEERAYAIQESTDSSTRAYYQSLERR